MFASVALLGPDAVGVAAERQALTAGGARDRVPRGHDGDPRLPGPPSPPCPPGSPGDQRCKDADADGFFRPHPAGVCPGLSDCNDGNPAVWPAAPEVCDGLDNDCGGTVDTVSCGLGACRRTINVCDTSSCQPGIVATESCSDGIDNNCNGAIDEGIPVEPSVVSVLGALFSIFGVGEIGVPASCGGSTPVCCPGGNPMADCGPFKIELTEPPVVSAGADPNRFPFTVRIRVQSVQDIPIEAFGFNCAMRLDSTPGIPYLEIRGEMLFNLPVSPNAPLSIGFGQVDVENLEVTDVALTGEFGCQFAAFGIGFFTDTLASTFEDMIKNHAQDGFCKP